MNTPRIGDVYAKGSDIRVFMGVNERETVTYKRRAGETSRRHYSRTMKLHTWRRWVEGAILIERGHR